MMAAQHSTSRRPGLPDHGSRGSSHGLAAAVAVVAASSAPAGAAFSCWPKPAVLSCWRKPAGRSSAAAVGSSFTALRYTWARTDHNASRGGGHGEHVPRTGDGEPDDG